MAQGASMKVYGLAKQISLIGHSAREGTTRNKRAEKFAAW